MASHRLCGLAGSLVVGLLELLPDTVKIGSTANQKNGCHHHTCEPVTAKGMARVIVNIAVILDHMAEQMEAMQMMFTQSDISRTVTDEKLGHLTSAMERVAERLEGGQVDALTRVAEGQERLLVQFVSGGTGGGDGIDAESRMRLRSIDVQLLRFSKNCRRTRER